MNLVSFPGIVIWIIFSFSRSCSLGTFSLSVWDRAVPWRVIIQLSPDIDQDSGPFFVILPFPDETGVVDGTGVLEGLGVLDAFGVELGEGVGVVEGFGVGVAEGVLLGAGVAVEAPLIVSTRDFPSLDGSNV